MSKRFWLLSGLGLLVVAVLIFAKSSPWLSGSLWEISRGGEWLLPLVIVASLIDSINPCAFSILLLTVAFLFSLGRDRRSILAIGGTYIAGIFAVYVLIGLGLLQVLHLFDTPHFMARLAALLIITFGGISLLGEIFPRFPIRLKIPSASHGAIARLMERASVPTAFLLGMFVGLCEFPCTGGPYLLILGLLHDQQTYLSGLGYLLLYNLIFVSPLLLILAIASDASLLERVKAWKKQSNTSIRIWGGIAMVALGLIILWL